MAKLLPAGWRLMRIDELGTVERGRSRRRPRNDPILYGGQYPFVQTGDIKAAGLRLFRYSQTYSEAGLAQSRLWPAGTLCITIAANICDTAILGIPACFPDSIVGFTPREEASDVVFVKYAIDFAKQRFTNISRGATQDNLSIEKLLSQQLPTPPFEERRRIASILGAYDDLIEVNRRRIALLEEMARRLFEEWFVRFRFPGHEDHAMVETPEGPLPEGWTMRPLSEIAMQIGDAMSPSLTPDQYFDHFSFAAFDQGRLPIREQGSAILSNKLEFKGPCILIGKLNPRIPRIWYVGTGGDFAQIASTEFVPLTGRRSMQISLLYAYAISSKVAGVLRSRSHGTSTSHQRVRPNDILGITVPVPDDEIVLRASGHLSATYDLADWLRRVNARLGASRDLLLPRLVSGELSVVAAERELEAVA